MTTPEAQPVETLNPGAPLPVEGSDWSVLEAPTEVINQEPTAAERIDHRLEQALEASAFKSTPELAESLTSFYGEQYALQGMIGDTLKDDMPTDEAGQAAKKDQLESIIGGSIFPKVHIKELTDGLVKYGNLPYPAYAQVTMPLLAQLRLDRLEHPEDRVLERAELMALGVANKSLFAEASVAVTTLTPEDKQQVVDNQAAIKAKMAASGLFQANGDIIDLQTPSVVIKRFTFENNPLANIERAEQTFWADSRFAGQLLFHNTYVMGEVWQANTLLPRRMQVATSGHFNTKNPSKEMGHSPTPHWSEDFDYYGYRQGDEPGTIAVPFAEMIKTAPYGRDAHYGTLSLKEPVINDIVPRVTIHDGTTSIGGGNVNDSQGAEGFDRTFYQSPYDVSPDTPLEQAPDGYSLKLNEADTWIQLGDEVARMGKAFGTGEHYAKQVVIELPRRPENGGLEATNEYAARHDARLAEAIQQLQHDSIAQYGSKLVVPLRANVMNFYVQDDGSPKSKPLAEFASLTAAAA